MQTNTSAEAPAPRLFQLFDGWGLVAKWHCRPDHLGVYLADSLIFGLTGERRADLARQIAERPDAPAVSGGWRVMGA